MPNDEDKLFFPFKWDESCLCSLTRFASGFGHNEVIKTVMLKWNKGMVSNENMPQQLIHYLQGSQWPGCSEIPSNISRLWCTLRDLEEQAEHWRYSTFPMWLSRCDRVRIALAFGLESSRATLRFEISPYKEQTVLQYDANKTDAHPRVI